MNNEILSNFVARLVERAEQCGDLDYVEGYLLEALKCLNLNESDLAFLASQTKRLEDYIQEHNDWVAYYSQKN